MTGYTGNQSTLEIPSMIEGLPVTQIEPKAFRRTFLTAVTIPGSVKDIGKYAFAGAKLVELTLMEGIENIDEDAFFGCHDLISVTIPGSVKNIGRGAFNASNGLEKVVISEGVNTLYAGCFGHNPSLKEFILPSSIDLNKIEGNPAPSCSHLKAFSFSVPTPGFIESARDGGFYKFYVNEDKVLIAYPAGLNATDYTIIEGVDRIAKYAFSGCKLQSITIPNSVSQIEEGAFCECEFLTDITIPDSVTVIGEYAFYLCTSLESITIPDSVTEIGEHVFDGISVKIHARAGSYAAEYFKEDPRLVID